MPFCKVSLILQGLRYGELFVIHKKNKTNETKSFLKAENPYCYLVYLSFIRQ